MADERQRAIRDFVEKELNEAQRRAATCASGPILVTACAGSGKTRVITARIAHMIGEDSVMPSSIVALTFTNKAAREMKERIGRFLGKNQELPFVGTFHAYCLRLLKQNNYELEWPFFSILDEDDQKKTVQGILQRNNLQKQLSVRNVLYQISQVKNNMLDVDDDVSGQFGHPMMHDVFQAYESEKRASRALDFDDLLLEVLRLFKKKLAFQKSFQEEVQHLLVDEYQDTNLVQHELLKLMTKRGRKVVAKSICAVGDEDQSIYSWRGATVANIANFQKDFPKTKLIKVEQNYRSVQPILDVANAVIKQNSNRTEKKIWSGKEASDRIRLLACLSEYQEAGAIAQFAKTATRQQKKGSVAVLYRTHAQSRVLEEQLIRHSLPYKIIGGVQFYERKEIKDLLAYLRLVVNPFDRTSFFRVINTPARGLGAKFEEQFYTQWHDEPFLTFAQIAQRLIGDGVVKGVKKAAVERFVRLFEGLSPTDSTRKAMEQFVDRTGYIQHIKDAYEQEEARSRIDNVRELLDAMSHFEATGTNTIVLFLEEVALMQERTSKIEDESEAVLLMTLHAAKGLEFDSVAVAGLEEGLLPAARALEDNEALEEERRLLYVGITRARERLLLTRAKYRYTYGQMTDQYPSRFLGDLPYSVVKQEDGANWNDGELGSFFADWFGVRERSSVFTVASFARPVAAHAGSAKQRERKSILSKFIRGKVTVSKPVVAKAVGAWRKNRTVKHAKYGVGLIQQVERKGDKTYVTVRFKAGSKKIISQYLQLV